MEINYVDVFREVDAISKGLRKSIKHMPRYNRYNERDRIICLLFVLKVRKRFILTHLEQWIPYISIGKGYQKIVRKKDFTV